MNTHVERVTKAPSRGTSAGASERLSRRASTGQVLDSRPETIQMRALQSLVDGSPRVRQTRDFQQRADRGPSVRRAAQLRTAAGDGRESRTVQRAIDDDLQALEDTYQQTDDPLLLRILREVRLLSDVEFTSVLDPEQGHAERQEHGDTRAHLINLDPRITDPETRQSLLLHELIHVSADRKYNVNQTGEPEPALTAIVDTEAPVGDRLKAIGSQARYREGLAKHLASVVEGDFAIDERAASLVLERVPRIQGASHREFDSVVTELYYRLKKMGVDERTDTFKEVAAMTAAAYRSRQEGLPLDQTYREPMKTGFLG